MAIMIDRYVFEKYMLANLKVHIVLRKVFRKQFLDKSYKKIRFKKAYDLGQIVTLKVLINQEINEIRRLRKIGFQQFSKEILEDES